MNANGVIKNGTSPLEDVAENWLKLPIRQLSVFLVNTIAK